jgi:hypothetical protein
MMKKESALMGVKPVVVCAIGSHIVIELSWFPVSWCLKTTQMGCVLDAVMK